MKLGEKENPCWLIGIDEAGYGPNLGPLVVAAVKTCWSGDGDWISGFKNNIRNAKNKKSSKPLVDDSKKAYLKEGVEGLEKTVSLFFPSFETLGDLFADSCAVGFEELSLEPWFNTAEPAYLINKPNEMQLSFNGFSDFELKLVVMAPGLFNEMSDRLGNKGFLLSYALTALCRSFSIQPRQRVFGYADKHGGRNQYAPVLQAIIDQGFFMAESEGPKESNYKSVGSHADWRFHICQKADAIFPLVGLASMAAKWVRERLMGQFNRYWQEKIPGLEPTAGYPLDAPRFYSAIEGKVNELGLNKKLIWRNR